jgi:hypothetical protein
MNFKYKLTEDKHAGTQGMFRDLLDKWDAEDKDKEAEIAKLTYKIFKIKLKTSLKKHYLKRNVMSVKP